MPKFVGPFQIFKKLCAKTFRVETLPAQGQKRQKRQFNAHVFQMFHARQELNLMPDNWPDINYEEEAHLPVNV